MIPLHNGFTILITLSSPTTAMFTPGKAAPAPYISIPAAVTASATSTASTIVYNGPFGSTAVPVGTTISTYGFTPAALNVTNAVVTASAVVTGTTQNITVASIANPGASTVSGVVSTAQATMYNPVDLAVPSTTTSTYAMTVSEVYMDCQILELGPVAESMILSSTGGQPLVVHTKSFRSYVGNVNKAAQEFILNLNLNVASMTNILWMMRSKDQLDKINYQSIGNRTRNMLQRWFFQYGSTSLPQNNGIQTMGINYPANQNSSLYLKYLTAEGKCGEGYQELMKARSIDSQNSRIMQENYSWDYKWGTTLTSTVADSDLQKLMNSFSFSFPSNKPSLFPGKFAGGLNLELASNKSGDLISGLNTNGMNTSIRGVFHPLFSDCQDDVRVDAYAEYDAFINISPGIDN
jgi:hypothetical protein